MSHSINVNTSILILLDQTEITYIALIVSPARVYTRGTSVDLFVIAIQVANVDGFF